MSTAAQDEFDQFIAKNTASSSSRHPEDRHDSDASSTRSHEPTSSSSGRRGIREKAGNASDSDADEAEQADAAASASNMKAARYFLPNRQHDANTGPKGVIADAYAFETAKKKHRTSFFGMSRKAAAPAANDVEKGSSEDELDDDFMAQWRQSRLQELRKQEGKRRVSPSSRSWGTLQTVDGEGYLDAVERSGRDTIVLVLIYDDSSDVSNLIEQMVRQLARAHTTTRFVRLHYEEAEMEGAGVPALLAYRNGDKFAGLVPLMVELPDDAELSAETLQSVLQRHQML